MPFSFYTTELLSVNIPYILQLCFNNIVSAITVALITVYVLNICWHQKIQFHWLKQIFFLLQQQQNNLLSYSSSRNTKLQEEFWREFSVNQHILLLKLRRSLFFYFFCFVFSLSAETLQVPMLWKVSLGKKCLKELELLVLSSLCLFLWNMKNLFNLIATSLVH